MFLEHLHSSRGSSYFLDRNFYAQLQQQLLPQPLLFYDNQDPPVSIFSLSRASLPDASLLFSPENLSRISLSVTSLPLSPKTSMPQCFFLSQRISPLSTSRLSLPPSL